MRRPTALNGLTLVLLSSLTFGQGKSPAPLPGVSSISVASPLTGNGTVGSPITLPASTPGNVTTNATYATQAALTLYVDPTGSDSGACTSTGTGACLTCPGVLAKVPPNINHNVQITFAAGSYAGCVIDGYRIKSVADNGGKLTLTGTFTQATLASGLATGTLSGAATQGSSSTTSRGNFSVTAAGWTTDDLAGRLVWITAGLGVGQVRVIKSNTNADPGVATIVGSWATAPNATSTFQIVQSATIFNASPTGVTSPGSYILVNTVVGGDESLAAEEKYAVTIERMRFNTGGTLNSSIDVTGHANIRIKENEFLTTTQGINFGGGRGGRLLITDNSFTGSGSTAGVVINEGWIGQHRRNRYSAGARGLLLSNELTNGDTTAIQSLTNDYLANTTVAISVGAGSYGGAGEIIDCVTVGSRKGLDAVDTSVGVVKLNNSNISNCATAVNANGPTGKFVQMQNTVAIACPVTGCTNGILISKGTQFQLSSASTVSGVTNEISLDGTPFTFAQMRAPASGLRSISDDIYNTRIFE